LDALHLRERPGHDPKSALEIARTVSSVASSEIQREERARIIADVIRRSGDYRWVGIYDVGPEEITVIGWDGPDGPSYPTFPTTQGLNGAAVLTGDTVIVDDVRGDPRYLTTLGSTRSEMVVPVKDKGRTVGTIDVESETVKRFTTSDRDFVESCARAILPLYLKL